MAAFEGEGSIPLRLYAQLHGMPLDIVHLLATVHYLKQLSWLGSVSDSPPSPQCCGSTGSMLPTHRLCLRGSYRTAFGFESRFSPSAFEGDQGIRFKRDFHCCALFAEPSCLLPSEFLGSLNLPRGGEGLQWSNHLTEIVGQ